MWLWEHYRKTYDELEDTWTFETSVRRHITKIEKRIELYEILSEEFDERGNRIYIMVKMADGNVNPFAKPKLKLTEEPTRDELINALIRDKYTLSQEFALINNFNINKDVEEYEAFQTFRAECKGIADNVMEQ